MTGLRARAAQKASELRMIKTQWYGDPSGICSGLGAPVPWGEAEVGTSGLLLGAMSQVGSQSSTKPSRATCSIFLSADWVVGGSGGFSAALMLGNVRD